MKICKKTVCLLAVILLFLLSGCGRTEEPPAVQTIKIWYINGAPDAVNALSFGSEISADIHGFDSEEELAAAFNTIRPDIIFCSMQQAEHMYENGHLEAFPEELFKSTEADADIISAHCFLPVGGAVELITVDKAYIDRAVTDFDALCAAAKTPSFVSVTDYSRAFAALLAQNGESFTGIRNRDIRNPAFVEVYNRFAELALKGCLSKGNAVCRIVSSSKLAGFSIRNTDIVPVAESGKTVLTEYFGFVCTGSKESCEGFISTFSGISRADTALSCGLVPVTDDASTHTDPLSAVLLNIRENCALRPVTADCEWLNNSAGFNEWVNASFDNLK